MKLLDLNGSWTMTDQHRVVLDTQVGDCVFSDNWLDVSHGQPRSVTLPKADAVGIESAEALRRSLIVRSLNDIMIDAAGPA